MNLSVIIFYYNEAGALASLISKTLDFLPSISSSFEIILVDDGSTDNSAETTMSLATKYPSLVRLIRHEKNLGIGMALRTGYYAAKSEYVCAIPGDGQFDVTQLSVVKPFDNNLYYSFYRIETNYNLYRRLLTRVNRLFNQHLLGIYLRDVNWIKVYRKSQLELVKPELKSSLIESEICAKLYMCNIMPIEIPSEYLSRTYGEAKGGSWRTLNKAFAETLKLIWCVKRFKIPKGV